MIAKRILSLKGGSGFQCFGADVLNVRDKDTGADPAIWQRLGAYILDASHDSVRAAMAEETGL